MNGNCCSAGGINRTVVVGYCYRGGNGSSVSRKGGSAGGISCIG